METTIISSPSFERALLNLDIDKDGKINGKISSNGISKIIRLDLVGQEITSLSGIESFSGLVKLDCRNNLLTSLNVTKNINLKELDVSNNKLTNLIIGPNKNLVSVVCFDNDLTNLDLGQNTSLTTLACTNNKLSSLDVSNNLKLSQLYCSKNELT